MYGARLLYNRDSKRYTADQSGRTRASKLGTRFAPSSPASPIHYRRSVVMLSWALAFFIIAIIAAVFGFTGIAAGAAEIAKILFVVFVGLFLVLLSAGLLRRAAPAHQRASTD